MEIKEMSEAGLQFLMNNEGVVLKPYLDTKGIPTIGVGSTYWEDGSKVKMTDEPISMERAMSLFKSTLKHYELTVYSITHDDLNQNQFDSLVSLCYNIGVNGFKGSTLVKRINSGKGDIRAAFMMWNKPKEILKRRTREVDLYFTPV